MLSGSSEAPGGVEAAMVGSETAGDDGPDADADDAAAGTAEAPARSSCLRPR